jgi:hypothetical protein
MDLLWWCILNVFIILLFNVDVPKAACMCRGLEMLNLFMLTNGQLILRQEVFCRTITDWQKCYDRHSPSPGRVIGRLATTEWSSGPLTLMFHRLNGKTLLLPRFLESRQQALKERGATLGNGNKAAAQGALPLSLSQHEFTALYQATATMASASTLTMQCLPFLQL